MQWYALAAGSARLLTIQISYHSTLFTDAGHQVSMRPASPHIPTATPVMQRIMRVWNEVSALADAR